MKMNRLWLLLASLLCFSYARADVYEIVVSRFRPGMSRQQEEEYGRLLNKAVGAFPGFKSRSLYYDKGQNFWVDVVQWKDLDSAKNAEKLAEKSAICQKVFPLIEEKSMTIIHADKVLDFRKKRSD